MIRWYLKKLRYFVTSLFITILTLSSLVATPQTASKALPALLENFKNYKTTNYSFHSGDLFEHSLWSCYAVNEFVQNKTFWVTDLTQREIELAFLGALLHDIGKAGDLEQSYKQKHNHPHSGFEYIVQKRPYKVSTTRTFDFNKMFAQLGITKEEQKIIAILVGCHYKFGNYMQQKITKKDYLDAILHYALQVNYDPKKITTALVKMAILVSAADVRGSQPVEPQEPFIGEVFNLEAASVKMPKAHGKPPKRTNYDRFNFDTHGQRCRKVLLDYVPEWLSNRPSVLMDTVVRNLTRAYHALKVSIKSVETRQQPQEELN